ncbi:MAG: hypothetical protein R3F35_21055 [Myxococcota bacterium]
MRGTRLGTILLAAAWVTLAAPPSASAQASFETYLDLDDDPATGCAVATVDGVFSGIEERLSTRVAASPSGPLVLSLSRAICMAGTNSFASAEAVACGVTPYPVGVGAGAAGSDVIETCYPLPPDPPESPARIGFVVGDQTSGGDALLTLTGTSGGSDIVVSLEPAAGVPSVSDGTALVLLIILCVTGARLLRRHREVAAPVLALVWLIGMSGVAWGLTLLNGLIDDWTGVPTLAVDATPTGPESPNIEAVFAQVEGATLFLRIDSNGIPPLGPVILAARIVDVDTVEITFDRPIDDSTVSAADFAFSGFATGGANGIGVAFSTAGIANDAVVRITLAASIGPGESGGLALVAPGVVTDLDGTSNVYTDPVLVTNGLPPGPGLLAAQTIDVDTVEITFDGPVDDSSVSPADFAFGGFATSAANANGIAFSTAGIANDAVVRITLAASIGPDETGLVALSGIGVITDLGGVPNTGTAPIPVIDGVGP